MFKTLLTLLILFVFLVNKKTNMETFVTKKYIAFRGSLGKYGLSHHKSNLKRFILKADELNKILIIPTFVLHKKHNNGKEIISNLSKYIDYDNVLLNGKKIKIITDTINIPENNILVFNLNKLQREIIGDKGLINFHPQFKSKKKKLYFIILKK